MKLYNLYKDFDNNLNPNLIKSKSGEYSDVYPYLLNQVKQLFHHQYKDLEYETIENYDTALDNYYSQFDSQKVDKVVDK